MTVGVSLILSWMAQKIPVHPQHNVKHEKRCLLSRHFSSHKTSSRALTAHSYDQQTFRTVPHVDKVKLTSLYNSRPSSWLSRQLHDRRNNVPVGGLQRLHCPGPRHGSLGHHQLNVLRLNTSLINGLIIILGCSRGLRL
jgi:hypothetical protein